jgi:hypothetical protein
MSPCTCPRSQYIYNASAYGFSAEFRRPLRHSIATQAGAVLGAEGGRGIGQVSGFKFDSLVSVKDAHTEVGGSYDPCHDRFTTYASATLEGVNVASMLKADQVVSKLHIYTPAPEEKDKDGNIIKKDDKGEQESSFTITGSHFTNLTIAGYEADVQLAASEFDKLDRYSRVSNAHRSGKSDGWFLGNEFGDPDGKALANLEDEYHAIKGMGGLIKTWKPQGQRTEQPTYWCSPAVKIILKGLPQGSDIKVVGNMVFIPKFGVIRLAEIVIHKRCRSLTMFRVQMCSGSDGSTSGGGTSGGGGSSG